MSTTTLTGPTRAPAVAGANPGRSADRLAEVYAAHWPQTVRFITRQVRRADRDLVPDLAQRVFLRAWPYLDRAPVGDEARMSRWLAVVARHVVAEQYRDRPAAQRAAERVLDPQTPVWDAIAATAAGGVADEPGAVAQRVDLAAALERLPADTRQILRLRILEDRPVAEVARLVGRERTAVIRRTAAGLAALRAQLTEPTAGEVVEDREPTGRGSAPTAVGDGGGERRWHRHREHCRLGASLAEYVRRLDEHPPSTRGADSRIAALPLHSYGEARWAAAVAGLAPTSVASYRSSWRQHILPTLGERAVGSIDQAAVDRAELAWCAAGASRQVVLRNRSVLARLLDQAIHDRGLAYNPARPRSSIAERATATVQAQQPAAEQHAAELDDPARLDDPAELDIDVSKAHLTVAPDAAAEVEEDADDDRQLVRTSCLYPVEDADALGAPDAGAELDEDAVEWDYQSAVDFHDYLVADDEAERPGAGSGPGDPDRATRPQLSLVPDLVDAGGDDGDSAPVEHAHHVDDSDLLTTPASPGGSGSVRDRHPADLDRLVEETESQPEHVEGPPPVEAPRPERNAPPGEDTAAAVGRARAALGRLREERAAERQAGEERARAEQLARWRTDDHAVNDQAVEHRAVADAAGVELADRTVAPSVETEGARW